MSYGQDVQQYNNQSSEDTRECEAMRKMFVGGLNRDTTEETFFNYFGTFGEMVDKVIITDSGTKQSRGFGFITYAISESVEKVFQSRPHMMDGKELDVKRAMPREFNTAGAHAKQKKLFVGGFKGLRDFTPEDLQTYIESRHGPYGQVESIDFLKNKENNEYKGFGFLLCSTYDFADRLAISENSFTLKGRTMSIKKAEPKEGAGGPQTGGGQSRGGARGGGRGGPGGRGGRGGGAGRGRGGGAGRGSNFGGSNYGGSYDSNSYETQYPSFGQTNNYGGQSQGYGYGQSQQSGYGFGQNQQSTYGNGQYQNYSQQQYGGPQAGRGTGRGGNNRYQPY